ncbi:cyclase family protein [Legionella spiritensis]|uniref:cyclase family protein n=1 Tax=Legionella spiritensis TaxID=452 RepID=UPI000F713A20|nr:cyclase family protein [Legionella spiritensis]VEG92147.1 metal-dependent hydrolase [Legionella spiritensis]
MTFPFNIIDLTHTLAVDSPCWDLDCGFAIRTTLDYQDCGSEVKFRVQHLSLPAGTGTHIDSPAHCNANKDITIEKLGIRSHHLLAQAFVIDVSAKAHEHYLATAEDISAFEKQHGKIAQDSVVIFHTGWEKYWQNPERYRNNLQFPSVHSDAAQLLLERNIAALGIDTLSPDVPLSGFPVHHLFLSRGKYLIENVTNARKLPVTGSWILTLPMKIKDATEAPARVIGLVPVI